MHEGQGFSKNILFARRYLENDGKKKSLQDKQNLRQLITTNLSLEEILKEAIQVEMKVP
jgi:hypothetical protein